MSDTSGYVGFGITARNAKGRSLPMTRQSNIVVINTNSIEKGLETFPCGCSCGYDFMHFRILRSQHLVEKIELTPRHREDELQLSLSVAYPIIIATLNLGTTNPPFNLIMEGT